MLPLSGKISFSEIRDELDIVGQFSIGNVNARNLASIPNGQINLNSFRGKYRELSQIDAYLFHSTSLTNSFISSFVPPTPTEIFNNWGRFGGNTWFPSGTTPTGEAAAWIFNSTLNRPECTQNTVSYSGFISNEKIGDFTLDAVVSSTNADDDLIGLVIAFVNDGTNNIGVMFTRVAGGFGNTDTWQIKLMNGASVTTLVNGSSGITAGPNASPNVGTGWKDSGGTRIQISKSGSIISGMCSPFGSNVLDPSTLISFDLRNNATTAAKLLGKQSYGYVAASQIASTFTNIQLTGSLSYDKVFDFQSGAIKQWNSTTQMWTTISGSIAATLGYPRKVHNPDNETMFFIDPYGVITRIS